MGCGTAEQALHHLSSLRWEEERTYPLSMEWPHDGCNKEKFETFAVDRRGNWRDLYREYPQHHGSCSRSKFILFQISALCHDSFCSHEIVQQAIVRGSMDLSRSVRVNGNLKHMRSADHLCRFPIHYSRVQRHSPTFPSLDSSCFVDMAYEKKDDKI